MAANHHPDGLTIDVITALQREVDDELRQEGYPVQQAEPAFAAVRATGAEVTTRHHEPAPHQGGLLATADGVTAPVVARAADGSAAARATCPERTSRPAAAVHEQPPAVGPPSTTPASDATHESVRDSAHAGSRSATKHLVPQGKHVVEDACLLDVDRGVLDPTMSTSHDFPGGPP